MQDFVSTKDFPILLVRVKSSRRSLYKEVEAKSFVLDSGLQYQTWPFSRTTEQ